MQAAAVLRVPVGLQDPGQRGGRVVDLDGEAAASRISRSMNSPFAYLTALVTSSETSNSLCDLVLKAPALQGVTDQRPGVPHG